MSIRPLLSSAQAVTAAAFAVLVNVTALPLALIAAVVIGTFGSVVLGAPRTVWQRTIHGSALGRVGAVFGIVEAAATLSGAVLGPILAQAAGLGVSVNAAALLAVAGPALTAAIVQTSPAPGRSAD